MPALAGAEGPDLFDRDTGGFSDHLKIGLGKVPALSLSVPLLDLLPNLRRQRQFMAIPIMPLRFIDDLAQLAHSEKALFEDILFFFGVVREKRLFQSEDSRLCEARKEQIPLIESFQNIALKRKKLFGLLRAVTEARKLGEKMALLVF